MESEHIENDRDIQTGPIDEKETVCNWFASNSVFGESIVILKKEKIMEMGDGNIHAFVVTFPLHSLQTCQVMLKSECFE